MKKKGLRIGRRAALTLGALALIAAVYVGAVLLDRPDADEQGMYAVTEEEITPLQAAQFTDASLLAQSFGVEIPFLSGSPLRGTARNTVYDGKTARMVTLEYDGLTIAAVRPASAAPLLLRNELSLSTRGDLTVLGMPAALAGKGGERCLYLVSSAAAYSIYAPAMSEEDFLSAAGRLALAH